MPDTMRVYALFDAGGFIGGFWDTSIYPDRYELPPDADDVTPEDGEPPEPVYLGRHPTVPAEAVEIAPEDRTRIVAAPQLWRWTGSGLAPVAPPPAPPPPMPDLSDRQFGEGLWRDGLISFEDYLAFVGPGVIPPALMAIIDALPDDDTGGPTPRKVALGLITGARTYHFGDPHVDVVRQAQGWSVEHLRERWAAWARL